MGYDNSGSMDWWSKNLTFNSLYGIHSKQNEQSEENNLPFNSLYGIRQKFLEYIREREPYLSIPFMGYDWGKETEGILKTGFQFPLWDTVQEKLEKADKLLNFQFPLWDTRMPIKRQPGFFYLSIPFMGYSIFNPMFWFNYARSCLSIPFMGYIRGEYITW